MANHWKKISDKLGSSAEGPNAADWAAMEKMIADQPALQTKPPSRVALKAALISIGSLSLIAALWFFNTGDQTNSSLPEPSPNNTEAPSSNLTNTTINADKQNSQSNRVEGAPASKKTEKQISEESTLLNRPEESKKNTSPVSGSLNKAVAADGNSVKNTNAAVAKSAADPANTASASAYEQKTNNAATVFEKEPAKESENNPDLTKVAESATTAAANEPINSASANTEMAQEDVATNTEQNLSFSPQVPRAEEEISQSEDKPSSSANDESPALAITDSLPQDELEQPTQASPKPEAAEDFINPATGFKLQSVNLTFGAAYNFGSPMAYGLQAAIDFQWNRANWFFQGGLSLSQDQQELNYNVIENQLLIDSSWALDITNRQVAVITRTWVIDSINAGHYEIDTTFQTVIDTNIVLNVDSNDYEVSYPRTKQIRFQYAELPILYGYQKQLGAWNISLAAGLSVQQALAINDENYSRSESFSLAILVQPAISYKINQQWSVFTRLRLQEQVLENRLFQTNQSPYSCQLGVSYHW